jgi:hypothetical protein
LRRGDRQSQAPAVKICYLLTMGAGLAAINQGPRLKAPEISTPDRHPRMATVAPTVMGGAQCLRQFRIRVQILRLKHVTSRQLLDGMSASLGSTASGTIFRASSRSGKHGAGLKKKPRGGCRRRTKRPSLILRSRDRIEPAIATQTRTPIAAVRRSAYRPCIAGPSAIARGAARRQRKRGSR